MHPAEEAFITSPVGQFVPDICSGRLLSAVENVRGTPGIGTQRSDQLHDAVAQGVHEPTLTMPSPVA